MPDNFPNAEPPPDPAPSPEAAAQPELESNDKPLVHQAGQPAVTELSPSACAARLAELFPAVFAAGSAKPLKLRIQADIQQRSPGVFSRKALSNFLHRHTTATAYLRALANGEARIDLDGAAAGDISEEHRQAAADELERRRGLHAARRAAERDAQRAAFREAQQQATREHAAQADARRERAGLLRAFESTTLTLGNFCALKSITPVDLEAILALARQDREQAPRPAVELPGAHPPANARAHRPANTAAEVPARTDQRERRDDDRPHRAAGKKRPGPRAAAPTGKPATDH